MSIVVENLFKSYPLLHTQKRTVTSFREALTVGAKSLTSRLLKKEKQAPTVWEQFFALNDVSFSIKPGSRLGILGKNGAGKSTLLKILSRITPPSSGIIKIEGRVSSLLEVGTGFHPELTGKENIYLNGALLGMKKKEISKKFDEIVAFAEIEKFLDTPVKKYSSGMYVRLAFAVAAHLDSEILILDEVLAVGDTKFQKKCLERVENIADKGRTVLFVSHNMGTITRFCNEGILLEKGKLIPTQSLEECIHLYHGGEEEKNRLVWEGNAGNQAFQVTKLSLQAEDNPYLIHRNSKGKIVVQLTAYENLKDLLFSFNIMTPQGIVLMQHRIHPKDSDHMPFDLKKGTYQIAVDIEFHLFTEGSYRLGVEVIAHNVGLLVQGVSLLFEVLDPEKRAFDTMNLLSPPWKSSFQKLD